MVPLGVRDEPQMETVKLFCPKCQDVYVHPSHAAQSELVLSCLVLVLSPLRSAPSATYISFRIVGDTNYFVD